MCPNRAGLDGVADIVLDQLSAADLRYPITFLVLSINILKFKQTSPYKIVKNQLSIRMCRLVSSSWLAIVQRSTIHRYLDLSFYLCLHCV